MNNAGALEQLRSTTIMTTATRRVPCDTCDRDAALGLPAKQTQGGSPGQTLRWVLSRRPEPNRQGLANMVLQSFIAGFRMCARTPQRNLRSPPGKLPPKGRSEHVSAGGRSLSASSLHMESPQVQEKNLGSSQVTRTRSQKHRTGGS